MLAESSVWLRLSGGFFVGKLVFSCAVIVKGSHRLLHKYELESA